MNENKSKLTLDQSATYLIKVPGTLDGRWLDWDGGMSIAIENDGVDPITVLTIIVDQAALHGLLRHLYSLGVPLISVVCVDYA